MEKKHKQNDHSNKINSLSSKLNAMGAQGKIAMFKRDFYEFIKNLKKNYTAYVRYLSSLRPRSKAFTGENNLLVIFLKV